MPDTAIETLTLPVAGMTCQNCVSHVRQALESVPGVQSAHVTLHPGQAEVSVEPGRVDPDQLKEAIASAGYSVPEDGQAPPAPQLVISDLMPGSSPSPLEGEGRVGGERGMTLPFGMPHQAGAARPPAPATPHPDPPPQGGRATGQSPGDESPLILRRPRRSDPC
jgi:copper chaperone CopZ